MARRAESIKNIDEEISRLQEELDRENERAPFIYNERAADIFHEINVLRRRRSQLQERRVNFNSAGGQQSLTVSLDGSRVVMGFNNG